MDLLSLGMSAVRGLAASPPAMYLRRRRFDAEFAAARQAHLFRGVYPSFAAAQASAPPSKPIGYDIPEAAAMYKERTRQVYPSDYPVMFWLERLWRAGARDVFDVGGHIGVSYYAYRRYLQYPQALTWTVMDVPAVVEEGRRWAAEQDRERSLRFTDRVEDLTDDDVLFASGSLQYLPDSLAERLAATRRRPRALLLNLLPVHPTKYYYTLQSIGVSFCPYRIYARTSLLASLREAGYTLRDSWANPEKSCYVAFDDEHSLKGYAGFLFER
jgi:putative methyltransferase (TIGR04325 family)